MSIDCQQALNVSGQRVATEQALAGFTLASLAEAHQTILRHETHRSNAALLAARPNAIAPDIREHLESGRDIFPAQLDQARRLQGDLAMYLDLQLRLGTLLAFPTLPAMPPKSRGDAPKGAKFRQRVIALTCVAGLAGLPQLSVPLGRKRPTQVISLLAGRGVDCTLLIAAQRLPGRL